MIHHTIPPPFTGCLGKNPVTSIVEDKRRYAEINNSQFDLRTLTRYFHQKVK